MNRPDPPPVPIALPRCSSISLPPLGDFIRPRSAIRLPALAPHPRNLGNPDLPVYLDGLLLEEYDINGTIYTMQKPEAEIENAFWRQTMDGRTLTYKLKVIQQPCRARACGAGPRSSADRRPVDPPPVIEFHILEGDVPGKEKDVTMSYDAGFMLHASLENARPIAGGQRFNGPMAPVLTGVPVAGTNYLDRPTPAAYFIFSDLSVRHEGWFRLRFSLFEKVKNMEDCDPGRPLSQALTGCSPTLANSGAPNDGMTNRMEVTSKPFQVYSAKKFPGLAQSTVLSRLVADQGCRVRIRRDVRQRKRPSGVKDEVHIYDNDGVSYPPTPDQSQTPIERAHSASRSEFGGSQITDHYRRQSTESSRAANLAPRLSMETPAGPAPVLAAGALLDLSQGPCNLQTVMAPPPPINTMNAPLPASHFQHQSIDSGRYTPASAGPPPEQSYYPPPPTTRVVPEIMEADPFIRPITQQRSDRASQEVVYDPKINGYSHATGFYNPVIRQWSLPEPVARKRSHSPTEEEQPLRNGQRPDTLSSPLAITSSSSSSHQNNVVIVAEDDYDGLSDDLVRGDYSYKRADGSRGTKGVGAMMPGAPRRLRPGYS